MKEIRWEKWAAVVICAGAGLAFAVLAFRFFFPILLPFLIAWGISLAVRPAAAKVSARTGLNRKTAAALILSLVLCFSCAVFYLMGSRLVSELRTLLEKLPVNEDGSAGLSDGLRAVLPADGGIFDGVRRFLGDSFDELFRTAVEKLAERVPVWIGHLISVMPSAFLALLITVIATFSFCMAKEGIGTRLCAFLPRAVRERIPEWRARLKRVSWKYLRAYLRLLALTFAELFVGFLILGVDYALLLALVIAVVDILPILGVGTVLIPWGVILLLQKKFFLGIGLLILNLASAVVRQIVEPRLVGATLGLDPILSLFAGYAGWRIFGFFGMLLGPMAALLLKNAVGQIRAAFAADREKT